MSLTPYYEDSRGIVIYHGDAREILPALPKNSVDLIVTDPPYGMKWQGRTTKFAVLTGDDGGLDVPAAIGAALPMLRKQRHVYVFGRFDLSALPIAAPVELIWDKCHIGLGDLTLPWGLAHEPIMFGVYVPSLQNRLDGGGALSARLRRGSVIRVQRYSSQQVNRHPTEKPVELIRILIESSSQMGETVLDPFVGSGTTLVAALLEGRRAIGIEIDEKYAEVAAERVRRTQVPMELAQCHCPEVG